MHYDSEMFGAITVDLYHNMALAVFNFYSN